MICDAAPMGRDHRDGLCTDRSIGFKDWYGEELGYDFAGLVMGSRYGFPFVHIDCDFNVPSRMGDVIDLTLLVERIGLSSLGIAIVCHRDGVERLRAHMVTAMMSLETNTAVPLPADLRERFEAYHRRSAEGAENL